MALSSLTNCINIPSMNRGQSSPLSFDQLSEIGRELLNEYSSLLSAFERGEYLSLRNKVIKELSNVNINRKEARDFLEKAAMEDLRNDYWDRFVQRRDPLAKISYYNNTQFFVDHVIEVMKKGRLSVGTKKISLRSINGNERTRLTELSKEVLNDPRFCANFNSLCGQLHWTVLHFAVADRNLQAVTELLKNPAVNAAIKDSNGKTAFELCFIKKMSINADKIAKLFLNISSTSYDSASWDRYFEHCFRKNSRDSRGEIIDAWNHDNCPEDLQNSFLVKYYDSITRGHESEFADIPGNAEEFEFYANSRASYDFNYISPNDPKHETILHRACRALDYEIVDILLNKFCMNVEIENARGVTPLSSVVEGIIEKLRYGKVFKEKALHTINLLKPGGRGCNAEAETSILGLLNRFPKSEFFRRLTVDLGIKTMTKAAIDYEEMFETHKREVGQKRAYEDSTCLITKIAKI